MMLTIQNNSSRQPFDMVIQPNKVDLKSFRIKGQGRCPPLINLLVVGASIGLFAYVNTYFLVAIGNVVNGSIYNSKTESFSCQNYFCDKTTYNFITFYSYYKQCNAIICESTICFNYDCQNNQNYDINYYYACQPLCGPLVNTPIPSTVRTAFIIAIIAACSFGIAMVLGLVYGIFSGICSQNLSCLQRFGLILSFVWPRLKYFAFRTRTNWEGFTFSLKCMVIVDMLMNFFYSITFGLYIALFSLQFWQSPPQLACFYLLIWATFTRYSMISEVMGPFFAANRQLNSLKLQVFS